MIFLDTDVLVDCLRGTESARNWLTSIAAEDFQIPGIVAMELIAGSRNQADLQRVQSFVNAFGIVWPEAVDFARTYELLALHRLASGLSIADCLIAAMTLMRSARLYTFNKKHFQVVPELDTYVPDQLV